MLTLEQQGRGKYVILASNFLFFLTKLIIKKKRQASTEWTDLKFGQGLLVLEAFQTSPNSTCRFNYLTKKIFKYKS